MRKVHLELYNWRRLHVARELAKMKTEEETRKREKLELVRWEQEIKKEEARRSTKERKAKPEEFEESPCDPSVSEDESEDKSEDESEGESEDESLFKTKFESESDSD